MGTKSLGAAFHDIARSIINDILQMTIKMLIFKAVSGIFGGGSSGLGGIGSFFGGARASGGPVNPDQTYLVGEKGPELFRPSSPGTIVPNGQLAANNNQRGPIEVIIGFGDAPDFAPYVQQVAATAAGQAVQVAVRHTDQTVRQLQRPKLMGR
jgi:phage-related minor tail protein